MHSFLSSFLATVFDGATAFNGDLNKWDVGKVTSMSSSKSIYVCIFENDLACFERAIVI